MQNKRLPQSSSFSSLSQRSVGQSWALRHYCNVTESAPAEETVEKPRYLRAYDEYTNNRPDEALNLLDQIGPDDEHYSLALALKGRIAMLKEDWESAMKLFESSLDVNDANSLTYYYKASLHEMKGEKDEAVRCLVDAIDVDPEFALARTELAGLLTGLGDFKGAIDHCNFILQEDPAMEQALYWKSRALFFLGRYQEALKIVEKYDDYADTYAVRLASLAGEVELALAHPKKAKTYFLKAYKENPSLFPDEGLVKLAQIYVEEGRPAEAMRIMKARFFEIEALMSHSKTGKDLNNLQHPNIDLSYSVTMRSGNAAENMDLLSRAYGAIQFVAGDVDGSIKSLRQSLEVNPKQLEVHLELIRILLVGSSAYDAALDAMEEAEKHFPSDIGIKKLKITTLAGTGSADEAFKVLNELESEPFGITQPTDAAVRGHQHSTNEASRKVPVDENSPLAPWRLVLLLATEQVGEGEALYQKIIDGPAYDPMGTLNLARAALMLGRVDTCEEIVRKRLVGTAGMPTSMLSFVVHFVQHEMLDLDLCSWVLSQIVKNNPAHVYFLTQLATVRTNQSDFAFATTIWKHITSLVPQDARPWEAVGNLNSLALKHLEALTQYKRAQECDGPDNVIFTSAAKEAISLIALGRYNAAIDKLEPLTANASPNIQLYSDIALRVYGTMLSGEFKQRFGIDVPAKYVDVESAIPLLRAATSERISTYTALDTTHETLANCLKSVGRNDEAEKHYKIAQELRSKRRDL